MLSKSNQALIKAYNRGYRVIDGRLWSPKEKWLKGTIHGNGYYNFGISFDNRIVSISVHRLVAYQKFGDKEARYQRGERRKKS